MEIPGYEKTARQSWSSTQWSEFYEGTGSNKGKNAIVIDGKVFAEGTPDECWEKFSSVYGSEPYVAHDYSDPTKELFHLHCIRAHLCPAQRAWSERVVRAWVRVVGHKGQLGAVDFGTGCSVLEVGTYENGKFVPMHYDKSTDDVVVSTEEWLLARHSKRLN